MRDVLKGHVEQFVATVTDHGAQAVVRAQPTAIRADMGHANGRIVEACAQASQLGLAAHRLPACAGQPRPRLRPGPVIRAIRRLHDIIVGAGLQSLDARLLSGSRREKNDRQQRGRCLGAAVSPGRTVKLRHHQVTQYQVRRIGETSGQSLLTVRHGEDLISRPIQQAADMSAHVGVIVGEQDARTRALDTGAVETAGALARF